MLFCFWFLYPSVNIPCDLNLRAAGSPPSSRAWQGTWSWRCQRLLWQPTSQCPCEVLHRLRALTVLFKALFTLQLKLCGYEFPGRVTRICDQQKSAQKCSDSVEKSMTVAWISPCVEIYVKCVVPRPLLTCFLAHITGIRKNPSVDFQANKSEAGLRSVTRVTGCVCVYSMWPTTITRKLTSEVFALLHVTLSYYTDLYI